MIVDILWRDRCREGGVGLGAKAFGGSTGRGFMTAADLRKETSP